MCFWINLSIFWNKLLACTIPIVAIWKIRIQYRTGRLRTNGEEEENWELEFPPTEEVLYLEEQFLYNFI